MTAQRVDRRSVKADARGIVQSAQVHPKAFTALFMGVTAVIQVLSAVVDNSVLASSALPLFVSVLAFLMVLLLDVGFTFYCMGVRDGQRVEFSALFDGFSLAGKLIACYLLQYLFFFLAVVLVSVPASMVYLFLPVGNDQQGLYMLALLCMIPALMVMYRYRFAVFNLCENQSLGALQAIRMSRVQTMGYKGQLFGLDMSFFGWLLASSFLTTAVNAAVLSGRTLPVGTVGLTALVNLWSLAVGLFYLARKRVSELSYFAAAKATSGVGGPAEPPQLPDGPDVTL